MIDFVNLLIKAIGAAVIAVLNTLPQTPFSWDLGALGPVWGYVNYFIPFNVLAGEMSVFLVSTLVWYGVRWLLRALKYIE